MDTDLSMQMTAMRGAATHTSPQVAMVKKNNEMDLAAIQMVDQVARSAPPPGQGTKVDKIA